MKKQIAVTACVSLLFAGCMVGPNYHRPAVQAPDAFRAPMPVPNAEPASLADLKWWEVFEDEKLQGLIRTALVQNHDLRGAIARVEAARAGLGITRSNRLPNLLGSGEVSTNRISRDGASSVPAAFLPSQNRTFGAAPHALVAHPMTHENLRLLRNDKVLKRP